MAKRAQLPKPGADRRAAKPLSRRRAVPPWLLLGIIAGVALIVVGGVYAATQALNRPANITDRVGEGASWGPEDAAVKVVDFSDFGCGHCANFAQNQGEQLRAEYESSGKVRFEFRHFIVGGASSANAANAAECAADQGKFWDYHDLLFSRQGVSADPFAKAALKRYAAELGLDTQRFNPCVDNDEHLEKVYRDMAEGNRRGVSATPTFFINEQKVEGAQPYTVFKAAVDAALAGQ